MDKSIYTEDEKKTIGKLINQLKNQRISFDEVPEEYRNHPLMVKKERKCGMRRADRRGYDVLRDCFFVEEIFFGSKESIFFGGRSFKKITFPTFGEYFDFLSGDIYENACYYQYDFSEEEVKTYRIDLKQVNKTALIRETIRDFSVDFTETEAQKYEEAERIKKIEIQKKNELNACNTYEEFEKKIKILETFSEAPFNVFLYYFYSYIFSDKERAFDIIMKYINHTAGRALEKALCSVYDPEKVFEAYDPCCYGISARKNHKQQLREYVDCLKENKAKISHRSFFDEKSHFYVYQTDVMVENSNWPVSVFRYFDTFSEWTEFLGNDLSGCDLSKAPLSEIDFSAYKTNEDTILPILYLYRFNRLNYSVKKLYDRQYDRFLVYLIWEDEKGRIVNRREFNYKYFFDFVFFLENDLSGADLLFCDGLENLRDFSDLNLTNVKTRSRIWDRLGVSYPMIRRMTEPAESFSLVLKNEEETKEWLTLSRAPDEIESNCPQKVYYISDLHLVHQCANAGCQSDDDVEYVLQRIIDSLLSVHFDYGNDMILIGGDTSSDFSLFRFFVQLLSKSMMEKKLYCPIMFLLGNHELWEFSDCSFEDTVKKYAEVMDKRRMYLLQNELLYRGPDSVFHKITAEELMSLSKREIRERTRTARLLIFGGLAFSGYNEEFNANNGIYRAAMNRDQEIRKSREFEKLYHIVCEALYDRSVIVFTHTPMRNWGRNQNPNWCMDRNVQPGFVYVSGHTHRNYFYDDGDYRIYADNQIGYRKQKPFLKYFYLDGEYDVFSEYEDGIHIISKEQYIDFYRGKKLQMQLNRKINVLYMLKKNGYYCFIQENSQKQLAILNGGKAKMLLKKDIRYYFDGMDSEIAHIREPLDRYTEIQKQIADEVKRIGGEGTIHGAIIDIDFRNHIFVNPYDLKITGYWASDTIDKIVYPSIPKLLESKCPKLYDNYRRLLKSESGSTPAINEKSGRTAVKSPQRYLETDIYGVSGELKKMQRLQSGVLTVWYDGQDSETPGYKLL